MSKIVYGSLTFTDAEIVDGEIYQALSLMCDVLEIGTMEVDLYIRDPATWAALEAFKRNDKLLYYHNEKLRGTYYIKSVDRTGKYTFTIKANDAIALLDQSSHFGGIYTGQTVTELVRDICNIPYIIQTRFAEAKLYGWLPIDTRRANLAQVLFAIGASAKVDKNGTLRIEALWNGTASTIGDNSVFIGDRVKYESKVTEVSVLEHQYIESQDEITLFEGTAIQGDIIQFEEPAHDLVASGFSILESGANWAKVSAGSGELKGKKYTHTTRDTRAEVTPDDVPNVIQVEDATLVSLVNSAAVSERLAGYYRQLQTLQNTIIYGGECPGDVVAITHPFGGESFGCLKSTSIHMGNRPTSDGDFAIGYRPPVPGAGEYDTRELLTGSGEWVVPSGVTSVRAVLIGGGPGGSSGMPGESPQETPVISSSSEVTNAITYSKGTDGVKGGIGGEDGEPGTGGKVLQVVLTVTPGQKISYSCGIGGIGGKSGTDSNPGESGSATTFSDKTSDDGASSDDGFLDPYTQLKYAAKGLPGVAGGNGTGYENEQEIPGNSVFYKGVEYKCGTRLTAPIEDSGGNYKEDYGSRRAFAYYGYGGGAAAGMNGFDGGEPVKASIDSTSATAIAGVGGKGADAEKPDKPTLFGTGGTGGNGGGGGGMGGVALTQNILYQPSYGAGTTLKRATLNTYASEPAPGGKGSDGGDGADGCIILFYTKPREWKFGPIKDKNGKALLDRLGRRIIV